MKRVRVVCGVVLFAVLAASALAQEAEQATVEVRGIRVVGAGYGEEGMELRPFNWSPGATLAVLVNVPDGGLLQFDENASQLTSFADDKGTDLLKKDPNAYSGPDFGWPQISEDGKACLVEMTGSNLPAKNAAELRAEGTLVFARATKKETDTVAGVALTKGTKFTVGGIAFEVSNVEDVDWEDVVRSVTLKTNADLTALAAIRFVDAEGKELPSNRMGSSTMTMFEETTSEITIGLEQKAETAGIAVDVWADRTEYKVPFSVKATLGF